MRLDYRGFAEHLMDHPDVAGQIGMKTVPHFTTFQKAARRLLLAAPARKLFDSVLERALRDGVRKRRVPLAAVDGTGWESRHTSRYYVKRRSRSGDRDQITTYAKFPKVVFVVDCTSHMILAAVPGRGPGSDLVPFDVALEQAVRRARIETLLADADFDAEWVHRGVRSHGIRSLIPPTRGRPTHKPPMGYWRRRMKQRFGRYKPKYGQRWQVETVNSMVKRRLGSALRARKYQSQCRETMLRAITHNVMIVRLRVFYRARPPPFFSDTARVQIGCLFQFRSTLADGLGIALQDLRNVLDPTMPQFGCLDSCVAPAIILAQRAKEPLHLPFDFRCINVHAALLPISLPAEGLITYFRAKPGSYFRPVP